MARFESSVALFRRLLWLLPWSSAAFLQRPLLQAAWKAVRMPERPALSQRGRGIFAKTGAPSIVTFGPSSGIAGGLSYRLDGLARPNFDPTGPNGNPGAVRDALRDASHVVVALEDAASSSSAASSFFSLLCESMVRSHQAGESRIQSVICLESAEDSNDDSNAVSDAQADDGSGKGFLGSLLTPDGPAGNMLRGDETPSSSFGGSVDGLKAATKAVGAEFVALKHGRLFGVAVGDEPMPFVATNSLGPAKIPELDEHYAARAVLLFPNDATFGNRNTNPLGRVKVRTNRLSLVELIARLLEDGGKGQTDEARGAGVAISRGASRTITLLSLDGAEPTEDEWAGQFHRLEAAASGAEGVELLRIAFADVPKPSALHSWMLNDWGARALSSVSTYTKRYGGRPVVVTDGTAQIREKKEASSGAEPWAVRIRWEDLTEEMEAEVLGTVVLSLSPSTTATAAATATAGERDTGDGSASVAWSLVASRVGADGTSALDQALPAEDELLQRMVEGLETAFSRNLAVRIGTQQEKTKEATSPSPPPPPPTTPAVELGTTAVASREEPQDKQASPESTPREREATQAIPDSTDAAPTQPKPRRKRRSRM